MDSTGNKRRLVELLKDNEVCRECGKKICVGCSAYLSLWSEAEMLDGNGVFCPPVKIGTEVFFVVDNFDPEGGEPVLIDSDKVTDVSVCGFRFGEFESGGLCDVYSWDELLKKEMFFVEKSQAEARYSLLMQKHQNTASGCILKTNSGEAANDLCDSGNLSSETRCEEMAKYERKEV